MGEWTPDMPSTTGGESTGLNDARNVYPNNVGYSPFPTPVDISPEADQNLTAVYAGKNNALVQIFAGSDNKLYKVYNEDGETKITDVSRDESVYSSSDDSWHFEQFGKRVLACKNNNIIQQWTLGSSSRFDNLTQAPTAKCMTIVRDFVVAGNIDAGDKPNLIQWSDLNNEEN